MYIGLHVSARCSTQILTKLKFRWRIFEKCWNVKYHENPYSCSW